MPRIRSADNVDHASHRIGITVTRKNLQQKIERMHDDHNDTRLDNSSYSTTLKFDNHLRIQAIQVATLISFAPGKLDEFDLFFPILLGDDFASLADELSKLVHLKKFSWAPNHGIVERAWRGPNFNGYAPTEEHVRLLGEALAKLPQLKNISIRFPHPMYFAELILPHFQRANPTLSHLTATMEPTGPIPREATERYEESMCRLLTVCPSLKSLTLSLPFKQSCMTLLGQAIRSSTSLSCLHLCVTTFGYSESPNDGLILLALAEALEFNSSLEDMDLFSNGAWSNSQGYEYKLADLEAEAFFKVLEKKNYSLKELELPRSYSSGSHGQIKAHLDNIQLYLLLNKLGRAELLGSPQASEFERDVAPAEDWFYYLGGQNNVSVLFVLLKDNPSLFHYKPIGASPKKKRRLSLSPRGPPKESRKSPRQLRSTKDKAELLSYSLDIFTEAFKQNPSAISSGKRSEIAAQMKELEALFTLETKA